MVRWMYGQFSVRVGLATSQKNDATIVGTSKTRIWFVEQKLLSCVNPHQHMTKEALIGAFNY